MNNNVRKYTPKSHNFHLRKNTQEKLEKSSITIKSFLESPYDSFRKSLHTSVCINLYTSIDLGLNGFGTLCLDFDRAHSLQVKVDG
jgi:hypothetical protein